MKIVILDGFTANPGDLEWSRLEMIGELTVYKRTSPDEVVMRCNDADVVFTNKTVISGDMMARLPNLKYIGVLATGYNVVDIEFARNLGIFVTNVPSYSTMSVAQNVFALLLEITNSVGHYTREVRKGRWTESDDFCFIDTKLRELADKQLGIIGFGAIGQRVAKIGEAFGMKTATFTSKSENEVSPTRKMKLDEIFATSDIITLHCPLTENTFQLVDGEKLSLMKPSAILINTGRGLLVDEDALANALNEGRIAAAGLDVLSQEPPEVNNPLFRAKNIYLTPHISWATVEARQRLIEIAVSNLEAFISGAPVNVVNGL